MTSEYQDILDWLSQAMDINSRIEAKMEQAVRLRAGLGAKVSKLTGMPKAPGVSDWTSVVDRLIALEQEIDEELDALHAARRKLNAVIDGVSTPQLRRLLEYRYFLGLRWKEVASMMHYSVDRIQALHRDALAEIAQKYRSTANATCATVLKW